MASGKLLIALLGLFAFVPCIVQASWGSPTSSQYHIQTDEGPERYFRYQTDNGQYRKEKRLEDGTVIGTDAWIDGSGYLRQKDYIADSQGYRILKSKTIYVGVGTPIQEAIKVTKKVPANAGTLVSSGQPTGQRVYPVTPSTIYTTPSTTTPRPYSPAGHVLVTESPLFAHHSGQDRSPTVYIRPHSEPIDLSYLPAAAYTPEPPAGHYLPSTTAQTPFNSVPTSTIAPPLHSNDITTAGYLSPISSTTARPPSSFANVEYGVRVVSPSTYRPHTASSAYGGGLLSTVAPSKLVAVDLNNELLPPRRDYNTPFVSTTVGPPEAKIYQDNYRPYVPPIASTTARPFTAEPSAASHLSDDRVPLFNRNLSNRNRQSYSSQNYDHAYRSSSAVAGSAVSSGASGTYNHIGNGYDRQFGEYDGTSVTRNGFRYYLPKQYHEEETSGPDRTGSFGYVDPFGIRRVVYYNASPEHGFVHRKNNRYVGHHATPYDPRPI